MVREIYDVDHSIALHLLGLKDQASAPQLQEAFDDKRTQLDQRLSDAPTDGLKSKYRQELAELQQAFEVASGAGRDAVAGLSATMVRDLPGARPVYTQDYGSHEPAAGARLTLSEGQVLADRYEVRRKLGAGGMGAVFAALDRNRDQEVAIKVLLPGLLRDPQARQRFMDEAKLSADLSHPHIVNVYDVQKDGDLHFITMELLEGRTLRQEMETRKQLKKPFTVEEVKSLARQLCEALSYAHKTTVHRDVKPENIWLQPDDNVKLMDFGIARLLSTSQLTMTGTSMGTAYYMAPEQLKGARNVDGRADQYALAAVMYEMLTGDVPAGAVRRPDETRNGVPTRLSDAVMKGLSPKPEERYPNAESFGKAAASGSGTISTAGPVKLALAISSIVILICVCAFTFPKWKDIAVSLWREHQNNAISAGGGEQQVTQEVEKLQSDIDHLSQECAQSLSRSGVTPPSELAEANDLATQGSDAYRKGQSKEALSNLKQAVDLYRQALRNDNMAAANAVAQQRQQEADAEAKKQRDASQQVEAARENAAQKKAQIFKYTQDLLNQRITTYADYKSSTQHIRSSETNRDPDDNSALHRVCQNNIEECDRMLEEISNYSTEAKDLLQKLQNGEDPYSIYSQCSDLPRLISGNFMPNP